MPPHAAQPEKTEKIARSWKSGGEKPEQADRVEAAMSSLDALADNLRAVERLRENLAALVVESQRLRADNVRLARALLRVQESGVPHDTMSTLKLARDKAQAYQQQVTDLLEAQTELESRVLELEELNSSMMSMYVSSFQLHATLDLAEVIRVIEEILVNFIGARSYAVLLLDDDNASYRVAAEQALDGRLPSAGIRPRGVLAEVLGSLTAYVHTSARPAREGVLAAVPLAMGKACVGAILVFSLFSQKERLLRNDMELFSLLGGHAASAIVSSRLYAKADRKVRTLQAMLNLLEDAPTSEDP
jgi:hypothetical protein